MLRNHRTFKTLHRKARGFVLLDAVIAILIFSVGILGMVSLQGAAIKLAGDAQYRSNAAMFADQVIAQMWGAYDPATAGAQLTTAYSSLTGPKYLLWAATLDCTKSPRPPDCLPGSAAYPPAISITNGDTSGLSPSSTVTVTVFWRSPNDTVTHSYVTTTQISR